MDAHLDAGHVDVDLSPGQNLKSRPEKSCRNQEIKRTSARATDTGPSPIPMGEVVGQGAELENAVRKVLQKSRNQSGHRQAPLSPALALSDGSGE